MKLLLVSCRSPFLEDDRIYPPLGLLYLKSAVLRHIDIQIDFVDDYDLDDLSWCEPYDYIGVSIMTPQREEATKLLHAIKAKYPDKTMICGGPHTLHYLDMVKDEPWDFIVRGDGERTLPAILLGEPVDRISHDFIPRNLLAEMPPPDRFGAKDFLSRYTYTLQGIRSTTMLTGRGCPMACKFCEDARTTIRWSSLENVAAELEEIVTLGYDGVYLFDDLFAINLRKCQPYLDLLKKYNLKFRCNIHANFTTDEFAKALAEAGCVEVAFGAESGSQEMLDRINKGTTVEQNYETVRLCQKYGIVVKAFIMIGLPGETRKTVAETEEFILKSGVDDAQIAIYYPYKGTEWRKEMDEGTIDDLTFEGEGLGAYGQKSGSNDSVVRTPELSSKDLIEIRDELIRKYKFYSHVGRYDKFFDTHMGEINA
ncbi:MAG: B12-binding domain-containing radical SAM protein [Candidatus Thorarchaeota archaeon]|jgi:radical SAM superfamily enzyme YgiQ (UPF0313 family)